MKRVISCVLLMLVLTSNAFALEVPTDTVVQNLNGSQQAIKTFTVSPEQDPAALIEEPFELEGYLYTFADIVKSENPVEEKRIHTEVITVETTKDDLALILEQLKPTIEYDDGRFQGTLALDHTSLNTVAAGYATKNYTVTETKTIGQLDRNDMSYVPATTIKNGRTLSLANVEWLVDPETGQLPGLQGGVDDAALLQFPANIQKQVIICDRHASSQSPLNFVSACGKNCVHSLAPPFSSANVSLVAEEVFL